MSPVYAHARSLLRLLFDPVGVCVCVSAHGKNTEKQVQVPGPATTCCLVFMLLHVLLIFTPCFALYLRLRPADPQCPDC
jgi:hypothetical protein